MIADKKTLQKRYTQLYPFLDRVLDNVYHELKKTVVLQTAPIVKTRVKEFDSLYKKILRVNKRGEKVENDIFIPDLLGFRVVCAFLEDLELVVEQLKKRFIVTEVEFKGETKTFSEFGYDSTHLTIELPREFFCNELDELIRQNSVLPNIEQNKVLPNIEGSEAPLEKLFCEIQVRTILQDAWAEVEHELIYKSEFSPFDLPLRRKLAAVNASLSLADIIFQEIRAYQNKLNHELDSRRNTFYLKADELIHQSQTQTQTDIHASAAKDGAPQNTEHDHSPFVRGTIDDMILEALSAHNSGEFKKAVSIYSQIIAFDPQPSHVVISVILKHRGMAFFAQGAYENAQTDFLKSVEYDAKNFQSYYYMGIIYSLKDDYKNAVRCFDSSLKINDFQSHVHYRKALAQYKIAEYQNALFELDAAKHLGFDNDETAVFRKKLLKKFDI
ncbi:MAG: RelA/SpoT domain-containing protein [Treponemataceae bacterium]|nr:MAG: RelA/SpoT domain-containing protein [Treponemataceae bacterium]